MEKNTAISIAKNKKATADELCAVLGQSDEIDLLLAKHPNSSAEILDFICERHSFNKKICETALMHPNISPEQLLNVGWEYPSAMFRNPMLPSIMDSHKNFLGEFSDEEFEAAFNKKEIPDFVLDWLVKQGSAEYQAIYLFSVARPPEINAKFRISKHSKIISQLLMRDDTTYLAWAHDLGFEVPPKVENEEIDPRWEIDEWIESLDRQNDYQWKVLVPPEGKAETVQGELIRSIGRLQTEYFKNAMMNWGDGSGHYERFTDFLHRVLRKEPTFSKLVKKLIDADIKEIRSTGKAGRLIAAGKESKKSILDTNFFVSNDVEKSMQRLGALVALWCLRNPDLIYFGTKTHSQEG